MIDKSAAQNAGPENAEKSIMSPTFLCFNYFFKLPITTKKMLPNAIGIAASFLCH